MPTVSRELVRAVLEVRDHRHNETHAALVGIYQALVAELLDAGVLKAEALAGRLDLVAEQITEEAHGEAARDLVAHITDWLRSLEGSPTPHPLPWSAPPMPPPVPVSMQPASDRAVAAERADVKVNHTLQITIVAQVIGASVEPRQKVRIFNRAVTEFGQRVRVAPQRLAD